MRITINIPGELIAEVQKITGEKSKTKAIVIAVEEYLLQKKIQALLALRGKVNIDYDWQKDEELEIKAQLEREKAFEM